MGGVSTSSHTSLLPPASQAATWGLVGPSGSGLGRATARPLCGRGWGCPGAAREADSSEPREWGDTVGCSWRHADPDRGPSKRPRAPVGRRGGAPQERPCLVAEREPLCRFSDPGQVPGLQSACRPRVGTPPACSQRSAPNLTPRPQAPGLKPERAARLTEGKVQSPQSPAQGQADRSPAETPRAPGLLISQVQTLGQAISSCSSGPGRRPGKHSGHSRGFTKGWTPGTLSRGGWRPTEPPPTLIPHRRADLWPPRSLLLLQ